MPPTMKAVSKARRRLFPDAFPQRVPGESTENVEKDLDAFVENEIDAASERWNFDFRRFLPKDVPTAGGYKWVRVAPSRTESEVVLGDDSNDVNMENVPEEEGPVTVKDVPSPDGDEAVDGARKRRHTDGCEIDVDVGGKRWRQMKITGMVQIVN
jgi:hypothetical protein